MKNMFQLLDLDKWLKNTFSKEEINLMKLKAEDYFNGFINNESMNKPYFLSSLLSYVDTKDNKDLCLKIVNKYNELYSDSDSVSDNYFSLMEIMRFYYKNDFMEEAEAVINKALKLSSEVIISMKKDSIGIPVNPFYDQLAIIYKKRKEWNKVLELCNKGKAEGWSNDFNKRIEEAKKHL